MARLQERFAWTAMRCRRGRTISHGPMWRTSCSRSWDRRLGRGAGCISVRRVVGVLREAFTMRIVVLAATLVLSSSMLAQTAAAPAAPKPLAGAIASHPDWPKAKPADVDSIHHILASLYDVISGPAHQPRDWVRMRSLFVPDAKLIPVRAT